MVETKVRHPKMFAALAGAMAIVAAVAMIGPRGGGSPLAVDGATAADNPPVETTADDGVVFTAPGELVDVFEPPETTTEVTAAGSTTGNTGSTGGSTAATTPPTQAPPSSSETSTPASSPTTTSTVVSPSIPDPTSGDTGEGDDPGSGGDEGDTTSGDSVGENASVTARDQAFQDGALLLTAPELSGTARGSTVSDPQLIAQVGTRDVNSVPWMLLIAANFGVTVFALVLLRLRR